MRRNLSVLAVVALFACAASVQAQQSSSTQGQNQPAQSSNSSSTSASSSATSNSSASTAKTDSLAEAARKARAAKQESPKPAKVFTNDNIPTAGGISAVGESGGEEAPGAGGNSAAAGGAPSGSTYPDGNDEKDWRALFANLQHKLDQDQQLLDVSQRELGVLSVQYYNDPTKALMQQYTRSDIDKKTAAIDQRKKDVDADKQAISDAQDALRRAGGDPGWSE